MIKHTLDLHQSPGLYFITLKVAGATSIDSSGPEVFNDRKFSDEFLSSLIYCLEFEKMKIYGFVILASQIHLIISPGEKGLLETIDVLKNNSAHRILHLAGQKMAYANHGQSREQLWLRRFFSQYINTGVAHFWQKDTFINALRSKTQPEDLVPLNSQLLRENLENPERNYMHLGAEAFTKLMLESMKS